MKSIVSLFSAVALFAAAPGDAGAAGQSTASQAATAAAAELDPEHVNFLEWLPVREFIEEMVATHGFEREALQTIFKEVRFIDRAVQLVKPAPPGKPKNWQAYSARFIEPIRIRAGVRFWNENAEALARAEAAYGVPAEIIVGIIGIETIYGRDTGKFRVLDSLTTLAFAYPETPNQAARKAFFRDELANTLVLARERGYDPFSLLGSFAGAVGMPQFMPSNILRYGVDFDSDGRVDLRGSATDAIGSVANFLVQHGWNAEHRGPTVYPADVSPARAWEPLIARGLEATLRPDELRAAGVATAAALPGDRLYGLIDLQNGADATEYWVANDNFYAITKYNRSYFYAMSVVDLGRAVRAARPG
ncbi:lytic murein transglycosylase B [Telluria beijingensis]|uniref:lytic murein transglycosylase B n=1 Tax=Telluria beijingensis TaxID=3068633 RepID=UPI00279542FB|nr:lytic murein transglycosylase B [Massilia sp. REN29]